MLKYLEKMLEYEENGCVEEAILLGNKLLDAFPDRKAEVLLELAKLEFRNGYEKEALVGLIKAYELSEDEEIYSLILEAYYVPNQEMLSGIYEKNIGRLKSYPHYRNEYGEELPEYIPVWHDEEILVCADTSSKQFAMCTRQRKEVLSERNQSVMMVNEMWIDDILLCEEKSRIDPPFMDMNIPLYLVYDREYWLLFLQLYDLEQLITMERVVFLVGRQSVWQYFRESMVVFPQIYIDNSNQTVYRRIVQDIRFAIGKEVSEYINGVENYYRNNADKIIESVKTGKPIILFWTCRFTTVLQYQTRDSMQAARRLGCDTKLLIEPDGIHRIQLFDMVKCLNDFKPDIIFCIDHFRFEKTEIPEEIVYVTWIQDPLSLICDENTPSKLIKRDFILSHYLKLKEVTGVDYPRSKTMDAPCVANQFIYKPYHLSEEEKEKYGADICMVCHASDVEECIEDILGIFSEVESTKQVIKDMLYDYRNLVIGQGVSLHTKEEMEIFIDEYTRRFYSLRFSSQLIAFLSERLFLDLNQRIYRQAIADWLIEAGYRNIKLWGNGWLKSPKYKEYAMGPAQNGEVLSKILQSTKIVLGNNVSITGTSRAWESMLSGAFYMSNFVPPEVDYVDIRTILNEKDFVMFYDKQDLLNKVEYYLSHESERKQMAERGYQAALEKMTSDALMKRMLEFLKNSLT